MHWCQTAPERGRVAAGFHTNQAGAQQTLSLSSVSSPVDLRKWAESVLLLLGWQEPHWPFVDQFDTYVRGMLVS